MKKVRYILMSGLFLVILITALFVLFTKSSVAETCSKPVTKDNTVIFVPGLGLTGNDYQATINALKNAKHTP